MTREEFERYIRAVALGLTPAQCATLARQTGLLPPVQSAPTPVKDADREETRAGYFERRESTLRRRDVRQIRDGLIRVARSIDPAAAPNPTPAEITACFDRITARWGADVALVVARDTLRAARSRGCNFHTRKDTNASNTILE